MCRNKLILAPLYLFAASKETPLLVTCEWTSVPNNENCGSSLLICRGLGDLGENPRASDHMNTAMQIAVVRSWKCYQSAFHTTSNAID